MLLDAGLAGTLVVLSLGGPRRWLVGLLLAPVCTVLAAPLLVVLPQGRAALAAQPWWWLGPAAAVLLAWWLTPRGPAPRRALRAAALLIAASVAVQSVLPSGTAMWPVISAAWTGAAVCVAAWRSTDTVYWPGRLLATGIVLGAGSAAGAALTDQHSRLLPAFLLLSAYLSAVGLARLIRWMRAGPPRDQAPPGVRSWPPVGGEVWNVLVPHEDGTAKDRPVLVWDYADTHADVLKITSQDKSHLPRHYLPLSRDEWRATLTKPSWLDLTAVPVPYTAFRSCRGAAPDAVNEYLFLQSDVVRDNRKGSGWGNRSRIERFRIACGVARHTPPTPLGGGGGEAVSVPRHRKPTGRSRRPAGRPRRR
ncbi:hypothetical protein [Actinoplanes sp. N902-109]|uniref:hypothetical protein n=1 Tax=Actinoplanes sp. (strain N902-109) TaxID=649831 RepID=UPI0003293D08|nr:hypothetical protein [Actinoplanes sp. N902-109]AGL16893.1 hypothetical protein L083_3383 [Actinoplanes sp. N902-109]